MKNHLLLFLLMGIMGTAFSQTYYTENFNAGSIPAGYVLWNMDGATPNSQLSAAAYGWNNSAWMVRPIAGGQTDYWLGSVSYFTTNVTADRWLCTPKFTVPTGSTNVLVQWDGIGYYSSPGNYEVRVSTTDSNTTSFTTVLSTISENPSWTTHAVALPPALIGVPIRLAFRNVTAPSTGYAIGIDNIFIYTAPSYDMSVTTVEMNEHNWSGAGYGTTVQGSLTTNGYNSVSSFDLNYSINGGATITSTITPVPPLTASSHYAYTHPILANPSTDGTYQIKVWCTNINGSNVDGVPSNDTATSGSLYFYHHVAGLQKKVVLEEMTGSGCPWAPGGDLALEEILAVDSNIIPVAIHSAVINDLNVTPADAMTITDGETVVSAVGSGIPSAMVDRVYSYADVALGIGLGAYTSGSGPSSAWETNSAARAQAATPVNVSIDSMTYDSIYGNLSVTVNATFLNSLTSGDFRTNLYIIEDSVIGTGNGYDQDNSIYSGSATLTGAGVLNTMPSVVMNTGNSGEWAHNHVLRQMLGGSWGSTGVIPASPSAGSTYSKTYTTTLPSTWRKKFVKVVGLVQEYNIDLNRRPILNASETHVIAHPAIIVTPLTASIIPHGSTSFCAGSSVMLNALTTRSVLTYQWLHDGSNISGATDSFYSAAIGGAYTLMVTSGTDTAFGGPVNIWIDTVVAGYSLAPDTTTAHHWFIYNNCSGIGPLSYSWTWGDGGADSGASAAHTYGAAGYYNICVTATDTVGCSASYCDSSTYITKTQAMVSVQVITAGVSTGIAEIDNDARVKVYPSPTSGTITIETASATVRPIEIYDAIGRSVKSLTLSARKTNIDLRDLADGMYTVSFRNNSAPAARFVIAR